MKVTISISFTAKEAQESSSDDDPCDEDAAFCIAECKDDGFCSIDNGWASTPSDYQDISDLGGIPNPINNYWQHDDLTTVLKGNVKMPDIFSQ